MLICKPDPKDLKKFKVKRAGLPEATMYIKRYVTHPEGSISLEDFAPGEIICANFHHTEAHYVVKGKAEITYSSPPYHESEEKITMEEGEACLILAGTNAVWKVVSKEPYRHICVIMPSITVKKEVELPPYA